MPKDSVLFRFRERDSREGITRERLRQLALALDLTETAAMHRALAAYASEYLPQYPQDDGPLTVAQHNRIADAVRRRHGEPSVTESLFEDVKPRTGQAETRDNQRAAPARKSVPPARGR